MQQTISQFLNIKDFPFVINDKNGNVIYLETSNGFWCKRDLDKNGNEIYLENSNGFWEKREYDAQGNEIYYEDSAGFWSKREYNAQGDQIYYEDSNGYIFDKRSKTVVEMTLQQVADKLGMNVKNIRIKD